MNNRQGMRARALGMLDSQIGAWVKAARKRTRRIYRMTPPKPLNEDEANKLMMEIFSCKVNKMMADLVKETADILVEALGYKVDEG